MTVSGFGQNKRRVLGAGAEVFKAGQLGEQRLDSYVSQAYVIGNRKKPRSKALLQAIQSLDTTTDPSTIRDLLDQIAADYAERNGGLILGLFSKCHLGPPFVDHRLSLGEVILEHYRREDLVPDPFSNARSLAQSAMYLYIEIYSDGQIVPVRPDGTCVI
jgi:hypothetical protein